jgi:hypothetical protein
MIFESKRRKTEIGQVSLKGKGDSAHQKDDDLRPIPGDTEEAFVLRACRWFD